MSHPTKRPLLHGQAPSTSPAPPTSTSNEAALPILEARFGVIAQALTGSTITTSAYSTIIPALQSFLSPALTVTRGQVFGPASTTATLPTTSPHPLQGLLIIDRSYPSISASPSSPAASDHWFPIESVAGYIELSDAYDEYELVRLRASIDQLHKLSLQSDTRRSTTSIPVFHLCLSSGTASLASASSTSLDLHVVAHSVALRFAHDTGMKGVFILNEGMVVRHDCLFPSGTPMGNQPSTAPFVVARIKTHGHGPVLGMALLLAHALAGVNNETSRNAHLIKQYAKASVWQATAPEPRSHQPTARSSVIAATAAAAQSVIQHVNKQQQSQPKKQESSSTPSQTQPSSQSHLQSQSQSQSQPQQKKGRGKKQGQTQGQVQGDKLSQTQPVKSRPQSATLQKKGETQEKKEEKKSDIQEKKEETKTASPQQSQKQQQQKQRPKSARTSMSATMNVEKKPRPSTAGPTTEKSTTSASVDVDEDDDDTDVRTDVDLTVVGTHVSGIVGDVKPATTTTENAKKGKGKKGGKPPPPPQQQQQHQQDETKQTSKPAVPVQQKAINNNHTTPGGPSTATTNTTLTNGTTNNKSSPNKKRNNRRSSQQRKNSNASYKPVTPTTSNVPLSLPSPPKSTAQVLAEKLLTSPPTTEKKESKTPYDDDFNPFA